MRSWAFLLGGLIVWAVHFFGVYGFASVFLDAPVTRWLAAGLTLACLLADAWLFRRGLAAYRGERDEARRWRMLIATWGAALSFLAVFWQGLPALLA